MNGSHAAPPLWGWIESLGAIAFCDPDKPGQAMPIRVLDLQELGFLARASDYRMGLARLDPSPLASPDPMPLNRHDRRVQGAVRR